MGSKAWAQEAWLLPVSAPVAGPVALLILDPHTSREGLGGCPWRAHAASAVRTVPATGRRRRAPDSAFVLAAMISEDVTFVLG